MLLAGGLRPDNVADAIRRVRPFGIDVSSGVEQSPGIKDRRLLAALFEAIRNGEKGLDETATNTPRHESESRGHENTK